MSAKPHRFGILAKEAEADTFERDVVQRLQTEEDCERAWRVVGAVDALPGFADFILDLSGNGAGRSWSEQTPHGVWFAAAGDDLCLDLEPALLANFAAREPTIPVAIARWRTQAEEAEMLASWKLRPRRTSRRHIDAAFSGIAQCFAAALNRVAAQALSGDSNFRPCISAPPVSFARILLAQVRNLFDLAITSFTLDMWNIGIHEGASAEDVFDPSFIQKVRWFPRDGGLRYRADPFGFRHPNGDAIVFHESYDYRTGKGIIAHAVGGEVSTAREFEFHAAYPFLFEYDGRRYCMPEQSESGGISVFAVHETSLDLVAGRPQLAGVPLVDGVVFTYDGRYWLLGTRADDEYNARLYAWYSKTPLGPWQAHACNPVKVDITSARSAGTPFVFNGSLIRPAQDCSRTYGGAVVLNRITALSPERFEEEPIGRIEPDPHSPYRDGVHTLCVSDGFVLVDGKYCMWHWYAPLLRIKHDQLSAHRRKALRQDQ